MALRDDLAARNAEHGHMFQLRDLTEDEAYELASGYVSNRIKSELRQMLDFALEDERRAARPVRTVQARISAAVATVERRAARPVKPVKRRA